MHLGKFFINKKNTFQRIYYCLYWCIEKVMSVLLYREIYESVYT